MSASDAGRGQTPDGPNSPAVRTASPGRGQSMDQAGEEDVLSRFDLRLRSLDQKRGEPLNLCSRCQDIAYWSVWLHTPEWGPEGGATYVLCTVHALAALTEEVDRA